MASKTITIITLLLIAVITCPSIVSASIPVVNVPNIASSSVDIANPINNNAGWYAPKPCYSCVTPTPKKEYEVVKMAFTMDPAKSTYKYGSTVTLTAYQTSGTPLGPDTTWQWDIPKGTSITRLNGSIVTAKLTTPGKNTIYIRVRDEVKALTGQASMSIVVNPRS